MDPFEPQLVLKKEVRFSESFSEVASNPEENFGDVFGGIIKSGQWGWLTKGSRLRITSLRTGQLISKFDFDESNGFGVCIITCVSDIQLPYLTDTIIAIGIQYADSPGGLAVVFSVEESTVIRCIELKHKITCCNFIGHEVSQHTVMQNMNGCLAIGSDSGSVFLVDLNLQANDLNASTVGSGGVSVVPCHIVDYSMNLLHLHRHFQHCQQEGVHFGIQLEVLENAKFIQSLLPIDLILSLAVGLADGRLVLYDLTDMQVFYVAPPQERSSPLVKMNFMEPPDDPRPCIYIWAFHENYQNSMAVMHSLMYEKRMAAEDGFCYFENFQVSCVRLLLPLNCPKSVPITCQAITKAPSHGNEETISLCALVWKQDKEVQTEVLLFDINQWYKEEMPCVGDWREDPSYLASFVLKGLSSIEMYFNPNTISLFNSIQRPEEHFYPISLSFDSIALGENSCVHLNWPGAQNRVINVLRSKGSLALLDPNPVFRDILDARLLPQFSGLNYKSTFSLKAKRETILSVAIEQNCIGLLKECAKNWSDGSHQGKSLTEGLSMSSLTDWLWTRASSIKERCNNLCQVLFNHSGCTLDQREQKELGYISKQLKSLADLLSEIISKFGERIPSDVLTTLESQHTSIRMASDYQEILLWLLNIGLLPEANRLKRHREVELNLVPYPYEALRRFYEKRRVEFTRLNEKFASRKTRSCYLLFIDSFIEHEFKGNSLRDSWQESGGDGLYPPTSIQAMLRIMLIPDVTFDNKCALFLYFFLDLNMAIEDKRYEPIVQNFIKFPSVFKLSASLIKQIQAFWNLDHCRFQAAVDEFISPFNKDQVCPQWQLELFLESLLAQSESNLALRVLEAKSSPISPVLQLNTYLANDLISEAFHFARSKQDEDLLKLFFTGCLCTGKFGVIRDLALTESEGNLVQSLLKNSKSRNAENLHFVYLLQKYKYIEAVSYLDELSKGRVIQRNVDVDTPTLVLSAYNTTMTPVTKGLSDVYFKIKNKIKSKEAEQSSPYPLSCQLIKQNANDLLGGIYHSSALSAHFASHYWERHQSEENTIQQSTNAPFLRRPQVPSSYGNYNQKDSLSYPDPYKAAQKRRLESNSVEDDRASSKLRENPKKRRKIYDQTDLDILYKPLSREQTTQTTADNLLTHFKNAPAHSQDMTSFTRKYQKTPPKDTSCVLETPYVKNTIADTVDSVHNTRVLAKPGASLQGILKISNTTVREPSVESEKREKKDTEEEKSIRFILPSVADESEDHIDAQDVPMESEDIEELSQEELPRRHAGPAKRKSLRAFSNYSTSVSLVGSRSPLKTDNKKYSEEQHPSKKSSLSRDATECYEKSWSRSPLKTDNKKYSEEQHPSKKSSLARDAPEWYEKETTRTTRASSVLRQIRAVESEEKPVATVKILNATESRSSIERASIEDSEKQPTMRNVVVSVETEDQSSSDATDSADNVKRLPFLITKPRSIFEKYSTEETTTTSNVIIGRSSVVKPRSSLRGLRSIEIEQKASSPIPFSRLMKLRTEETEEQPGQKITTDIPIISIDENSSHDALKFEDVIGTDHKIPKRALSESSDDHTHDSTHFVQRKAKQLKGRGSIHSSFGTNTDQTTSKAPDPEIQTKSNLQPAKTILKTDTTIDFQPYVSSSKVCATESKFNVDSTDSKFHFEKVNSKVTFAERSTVVGGLSYLPTFETTEYVTETISTTNPLRNQMLDTTVDMTLYDTMGVEQSDQKLSNENSSSLVFLEEESINSELIALDDQTSENAEEDDDNSVILLSSRSSTQTFYGNGSETSESRTNDPVTGQSVIDDEEYDDNDSDGVDILVSDGSDYQSNSYSNKFSEVTRTSTSCSIPSNADTILSSAAENEAEAAALSTRKPLQEVEEGEDYEENTNSLSVSKECETNPSNTKETHAIDKTTVSEKADSEKPANKPSVIEEQPAENKDQQTTDSSTILVADAEIEEIQTSSPGEEGKEKLESEAKRVKVKDATEEISDIVNNVSESAPTENVEQAKKIEKPAVPNKGVEVNKSKTQIEAMKMDETTIPTKKVEEKTKEKSTTQSEEMKIDPITNKEIEEESTAQNVEMKVHEAPILNKRVEEEARADESTPVADIQSENMQTDESPVPNKKVEEEAKSEEVTTQSEELQIGETAVPIKGIEEETKLESEEIKVVNKSEETATKSVESEINSTSTETIVKSEKLKGRRNEPDESKAEKTVSKVDLNTDSKEKQNKTLLKDSTTEVQGEEKEKPHHIDEELTPNFRRRRSSSFSQTLTSETDAAASPSSRRQSRGGSMPPTSANQIVTRRRSLLLETLNEATTPDSPSRRTRSKLRSDSIDGDVESPTVSNVKRSRLSSISSVTSVELPQTPKSRRRSSVSVDKDLSNTPKATGTPRSVRAGSLNTDGVSTPVKTPRRLSISKKKNSPTDQSSSKSPPKEADVTEKEEVEPEISQVDDYKSTRRLTRTQLAVLEKSAALAAQFAISPAKVTKSRVSRAKDMSSTPTSEAKISDTESVTSQISHLSNSTTSRRITRSSALKENPEDDDATSIASSVESGKKRRKRAKEPISPGAALTAIPEEEPPGSDGSLANSQTSKRSRRQK